MERMRTIRSAVVTGPTGAIGTSLCELLAENGVEATAVTHPGSRRTGPLKRIPGLRLVECDIAALSGLPELRGSSDAFFHLAWAETAGAGRDDMPAQIDNIRHAVDACRAAKALGCAAFVGAGSQAEYGRVDRVLTPDTPCFPENGYGMAKLCAGQMSRAECERLGIDHVWARILSVYGPRDGENAMIPRVIRMLLAGERPALTAGGQIWDYL